MNVCEKATPAVQEMPAQSSSWSPLCCGQAMFQLLRRMLVLSTGKVLFSSVWNCTYCGRLMQ